MHIQCQTSTQARYTRLNLQLKHVIKEFNIPTIMNNIHVQKHNKQTIIHQTNAELAGSSPKQPNRARPRNTNQTSSRPRKSHVLCITSQRESHRVDKKVAAFVKMRDSVSFYKIDPDEYVLKSNQCWRVAFYSIRPWSVRLWHCRAHPIPSEDSANTFTVTLIHP